MTCIYHLRRRVAVARGARFLAASEDAPPDGGDPDEPPPPPGDDGKFVDEEFGPCDASIAGAVEGAEVPADVQWVRAAAMRARGGGGGGDDAAAEDPVLFDGVAPSDIAQGALGDCWLLAALAAVAEFPSYFEDAIFETKTFSPEGEYALKLYDIGKKAWETVTVDSYIPCHRCNWWDAEVRDRPRKARARRMDRRRGAFRSFLFSFFSSSSALLFAQTAIRRGAKPTLSFAATIAFVRSLAPSFRALPSRRVARTSRGVLVSGVFPCACVA